MPDLTVDNATIHYEQAGEGESLVLVHGSWDEQVAWVAVIPPLADSFRVTTYDRRGHGASDGGGPVEADADDLAALIEHTGGPAHVACNSFGGVVALRLATRRPDLLRTLSLHEPPLLGLLGPDHPAVSEASSRMGSVLELLAAGRAEEGAQRFADDVALGPGAWEAMPQEERDMMVRNAHTFLEETEEETALFIAPEALAGVDVPVLLTGGTDSPPFFAEVLDMLERTLPRTRREALQEAGHIPHVTHPEPYAGMLRDFATAG